MHKVLVPVLVFLSTFVLTAYAVRPDDQILVNDPVNGDTTYFIANETYTFDLEPAFWVPLKIKKHVIYTATSDALSSVAKNLFSNKRAELFDLSPEDHQFLSRLVQTLPPHLKVNAKKRSLAPQGGVRRIDLAPDHFFIIADAEETDGLKRNVEAVPIGQTTCLHIPFFTTCDNSADLNQVRNALTAQNDAINKELDSYKKTNDARDREMVNALNKQAEVVKQMVAEQSNLAVRILDMVSAEKTNLVQTQHGDQVAHAQVNALKRITTALLRYNNAMGSTDPRLVVAQPALAKLFRGFTALLTSIQNPAAVNATEPQFPVTDSRRFNFTEQVLPDETVSNVEKRNSSTPRSAIPSHYRVFPINYDKRCKVTVPGVAPGTFYCNTSNPDPWDVSTVQYILGPFHTKHWGIYLVNRSSDGLVLSNRDAQVIVQETPPIPLTTSLNCINFMGFPMLATFTFTPSILNGIPTPSVLPMENCDQYLVINEFGTVHFRLFAQSEGITIPFYSNCNISSLINLGLSLPVGYFSGFPNTVTTSANTPITTVVNIDQFSQGLTQKHYVSKTCYINIDPEWLKLSYFVETQKSVIANIPRGYKLNQFTINPLGELASSLEFVYTPEWALVYKILRTSVNKVIVDEADVLHEDMVLFQLRDNTTIVDESDSFYGEGNNGRDCIRAPLGAERLQFNNLTFDYDITDCFFQNEIIGTPVQNYLSGLTRTTGIARFNNKFKFALSSSMTPQNLIAYSFNLTARPEADFRFYLSNSDDVCPMIISRSVDGNACVFNFKYTGFSKVYVGGVEVPFNDTYAYDVRVPASRNSQIIINTSVRSCLVVRCTQTINSTYVQLDTPAFSVVSQDDLALETAVDVTLQQILGPAVSQLNEVEAQSLASLARTKEIGDKISAWQEDLNRTRNSFPYKNFSKLREQVASLSANVGDQYCSGPFASIDCWLKDFGATFIGIGIALVVLILIYLLYKKTPLGKQVKKAFHHHHDDKHDHKEHQQENPKKEKKEKPKETKYKEGAISDFELIGSS